MSLLAGIDIGGTKCAVSLGRPSMDGIEIVGKHMLPTAGTPDFMIGSLLDGLDALLAAAGAAAPAAVGISCGGPLDAGRGLILSPPNLPGWDLVDIVGAVRRRHDVPVALENDANAGALAEWQWGAGRGTDHMVFLTFGTGLGAGLILNGRLYAGANGMAGEAGHMRLSAFGPVGYGKQGSFEGFCSGGGIAQLAASLALEQFQRGHAPSYCASVSELGGVTAQRVGEAALAGDETALEALRISGDRLGRGLALIVDLLNPERIVIGSVYAKLRSLLEPPMLAALQREALTHALDACSVLPAALGDRIGDYAGLSVASDALRRSAHSL
ncbi:ROK family protein [Cohnella rhizosphaerae]|uniref:ROK family protein n=1 Tax=Cohnella rhizosphaerae TaxID=1457232 RepID=A0A9X4L082_9BACL|nr:ROK family protein [Cohnella rhizosphaerae]MDG0813736.1 ROK family protein [Cohnella rhizosphaerae]